MALPAVAVVAICLVRPTVSHSPGPLRKLSAEPLDVRDSLEDGTPDFLRLPQSRRPRRLPPLVHLPRRGAVSSSRPPSAAGRDRRLRRAHPLRLPRSLRAHDPDGPPTRACRWSPPSSPSRSTIASTRPRRQPLPRQAPGASDRRPHRRRLRPVRRRQDAVASAIPIGSAGELARAQPGDLLFYRQERRPQARFTA